MIEVELRVLAGSDKGTRRLKVEPDTTCNAMLGLADVDTGRTLVVLVNGRCAAPDSALSQGDVVSVFPPVTGG